MAHAAVIGEVQVQRGRLQAQCRARRFGQELQADAFLRLQADHQAVLGKLDQRLGKQRVRHVMKTHHDLRQPLRHALAGAQVERHAGPAPVGDLGLDGDEGLGATVLRNTVLGQVALHRLPGDGALQILAAHGLLGHLLQRDRLERLEDLQLLVTDGVLRQAGRRLHGDDAHQLQQVVLHHIAQGADAVVEVAALLHAELLGDGDLHVLDPLAAPQRLEQRVAEADRHQVLHRLLAEVVVDPVDLVFGKELGHGRIDALVGGQVGAQRLLEHQPHVGRVQADAGKLRADVDENAGRGGQVAHGDRGAVLAQRGGQGIELFRLARIDLLVDDAGDERGPGIVRHGRAGIQAHGGAHLPLEQGQVTGGLQRLGADGKDPPARMELAPLVRIEQGRNQLAAGQITRTAKQHHVECGHRHRHLLSVCEPSDRLAYEARPVSAGRPEMRSFIVSAFVQASRATCCFRLFCSITTSRARRAGSCPGNSVPCRFNAGAGWLRLWRHAIRVLGGSGAGLRVRENAAPRPARL